MNAQSDVEKNLSPATGRGKRPPLVQIAALSVLGLVVVCLGLWMLVFKESGLFAGPMPNLTATALAANDLACKKLVEQAMSETDKFCKDIGTNQLCYGNFSIDAELAEGASEKFSQRGDVIDVDLLRRLSAAPLDLVRQAWGIAVFKVTANLPRSLPGQTITLLVFGNTTLNKDEPGLQTFYFFSDTGQVICDAVPFDGLLISMPDGVGARFNINGSELVLTGTASITANLGGEMNISLYDGSAQVTANGETQVFGAGEQVSIPLGGENGLDPVGPPSDPVPLPEDELVLSCTMTGENCDLTPIPTLALEDLEATLEAGQGPTTQPTGIAAVPSATLAATALPSPTSFPPSATYLPPRTATRAPTSTPRPNSTNTRTPVRTPTGTAIFTPTFTRTFTPTNTNIFTPTFTPTFTRTFTPTSTNIFTPTFTPTFTRTFTPTSTNTFTPTNTGTFTPTNTGTFTPTSTGTFTPTNTGTFTPTSTHTFTPTFTAIFTPTNTSTPSQTPVPPACSVSAIAFSSTQMSVAITNNSGATVTLNSLVVNWVNSPSDQRITAVSLAGLIWSGLENNTPSTFTTFNEGTVINRQIANGSTETLAITFNLTRALQPGTYSLTATFDGCTVSQSGEILP